MSTSTVTLFSSKPFAAVFFGLALAIVLNGATQLQGYQAPSSLLLESAQEQRVLIYEDTPQSAVNALDAKTGGLVATFGHCECSFVRATLLALVNDRRHKAIPLEGDFRLERHTDPQIFKIDEAAGKTISLNAFVSSNTAAFVAFMSDTTTVESL